MLNINYISKVSFLFLLVFFGGCTGSKSSENKSPPNPETFSDKPTNYNPTLSPANRLSGSSWGVKSMSDSGFVNEAELNFTHKGVLIATNTCTKGGQSISVSAAVPYSEVTDSAGRGYILTHGRAESEEVINGESCYVLIENDRLDYEIQEATVSISSKLEGVTLYFYRIK